MIELSAEGRDLVAHVVRTIDASRQPGSESCAEGIFVRAIAGKPRGRGRSQVLGTLGFVLIPDFAALGEYVAPVPEGSSCVLLARKPRMLLAPHFVRTQHHSGCVAFGVFLAADPFDTAFALTEPAAHTGWVSKDYMPRAKARADADVVPPTWNPVKQALDNVDAAIRDELDRNHPVPSGASTTTARRLAEQLGSLFGGEGRGIGRTRKRAGGGAGGGTGGGGGVGGAPQIANVGTPTVGLVDGQVAVVFPVDIGAQAVGSELLASVVTYSDSGRETRSADKASGPPRGAKEPLVLAIFGPSGESVTAVDGRWTPATVGEHLVSVERPIDVAIGLEVRSAD